MSTSWTTLCGADDLPDGEARAFEIGEARLCLVNDAGSFFCVDDLCTHGRAFLSEGYCDTEDCVLECPLHGGLFDYKSGEACGDPAEKPVRTYPVRIEDGQVQVRL
ncbi:probable ferredoxin subunit of a ring-hydroxylating dioxygenaseoxidoreductase protein [Pseudooceanicola batsensis HTCC2597]|uniref:Probable ferredoxin subunit of a ring-hydroxylating dioxygenaseoxidoreductase protein n=1 Tax=Pseudooceanicola batsensis (strain ATCC BAA-863 / DSM 15984 / KCTC 12145 / HTCC2597) TaxID=252305 RepID=A3U0T4_PSEBH|nr:non-heme iron oxygenase ferredoxin subunit [Pseudooceanicola batsensis]EAQ02375.1 probable ferredoxin subunit of a ring-hydroxylating dioxygenaseoxidoreductase protein [Pseudooceanicola batsensis HTCC2597]